MGYCDNLRRLCESKGWNQADLAARLGLSRSSLSRILRGVQEPKVGLAYELAQMLGVSLDALMEGRAAESSPRTASLDEEEWAILRIVRRLGTTEALDRLIGADRGGLVANDADPAAIPPKG
jgi:putative transcriptional regulator